MTSVLIVLLVIAGYLASGVGGCWLLLPSWWEIIRKDYPGMPAKQREEILFLTLLTIAAWPGVFAFTLGYRGMIKLVDHRDPQRLERERSKLEADISRLEREKEQWEQDRDRRRANMDTRQAPVPSRKERGKTATDRYSWRGDQGGYLQR